MNDQIVSQRDATLAKQLFSSLFAGVLVETEASKSNKETANIMKDLLQTLNTFLSTSTVYFPPFISCVQVCGQKCNLHKQEYWTCDIFSKAKIFCKPFDRI